MPTTETRTDPDDIYGWTTIESTFDDGGLLTSKLTTYDNGTTRQDDFYPDGYVDPLNIVSETIGQVTLMSDLPIGAGSLHSWDSILTYYSETTPGQRLFQQTIDDTGLEKNTTYGEDGAITGVAQYDLGDVKSWDSYVRTYGEDPRISSTRIVYDDGDVYEKTSQISSLFDHPTWRDETVTREDVSGSQDYVYQTEVHLIVDLSLTDPLAEDVTHLIEAETLYDDGVLVEYSSDDLGGYGYYQVSTDQNDAHDWETITADFATDYSGSIKTIYDDGSMKHENFVSGSSAIWITNAAGINIYSEGRFYDDNGNLTEISASGLGTTWKVERFEDGIRTLTMEFDSSYDVESFSERHTNYDENGVISTRETYFDNGQEQTELFYSSGVRQNTIVVDAPDIANYALKADAFDETGALTERRTHYDDGREVVDSYTNGTRDSRVTTDQQDAYDFVLKADVFDANGDLVNRYVQYDDGRYDTEYFEGNVRTAKVTEDQSDAYNYIQKASVYGADGVLTERNVSYDDGRTLNSYYDEGRLAHTVIEDTADAFNYEAMHVFYDQAAGIEIRETTYDDGRVRTQAKEDGVVLFVTDEDKSAGGLAYNYSERATVYDADGTRLQTRTELDSGDQFVFNYADGAKEQRLDYDGNDSETWLFKVTDYAPDETPVVTYYDTFAETPTDIIDDFNFLMV
ncbi:MAG: hypothetical protein ABJO29_15440 [Yoonia sp.]|uniref:hypothetical protein n=1 Tax=Yoonia sp. TaxID=2212373 RepID=UPI003265F0E6